MKKTAKILLAVILLAAVAAGAFFVGRITAPQAEPVTLLPQTFYAVVQEVGDGRLLVEGLPVNDINHRGAFQVPIREDTALVWRYTPLLFEELKAGQNVAVTYTGYVLTTYPGQLTEVLRVELLDDDKEHPSVIVTDIVDRAEEENLPTDDALEGFWKDEEYTYYFSGIKSHYIIVHYSNGTQEPVRDAMAAGRVTIADLDRFGIGYYKEEVVTVAGMECKEGVLDALGYFWSDEEYDYFFPNYDTEVTVHLSDGHSWPLHDALMAGLVTVSDLDIYGITYYKEPKE